uniref:Luciferin 4-monooxygenase n=1 Tax=Lygus hesperus TaxID=30085 RepID=A0A146LRY2_LYGHE
MAIGTLEEDDDRIAFSQDLPTLLLHNLRKFGDRTFLVDGIRDIKKTYKEVHDEAIVYALALKKLGVRDGSYVACLTESHTNTYIFKIAVWLAGGCICPLNINLTPGEISTILNISTSDTIYCSAEQLQRFEEKIRPIVSKPFKIITDNRHDQYPSLEVIREELKLSQEELSTFSTTPYDPREHITYLLFTSGTTGVPKGVRLSSIASLLNGCRISIDKTPTFLTSPVYWISNSAAFLNAILEGTELISPGVKYLPGTEQEDLYHLLECIQKYKPGKWQPGISTIMDICLLPNVKKYDLSSLTHLAVGGSLILPSQKKFVCDTLFGGRNIIQERFGTTENGFLTRQWSFPPPDFNSPKYASFGPPSPGVIIKIVDDSGNELGPHQVGEIVVKSNCTMKGYINEELPEEYTPDDWYPLGDLGYYDEDGWFYFKARIKELIKYRGSQLMPADVEKVLLQHPDVVEVCVTGKPHPIDGEHPTAFVVKRANSSVSESELIDFVAERVDNSKKLRGGVFFAESLPKSGAGKLLRRNVKDSLVKMCAAINDV